MCGSDQGAALGTGTPGPDADAGSPGSTSDAMKMVLDGLSWLAKTEAASMPGSVQADCLRDLERVESVFTAARASVLSAFDHNSGYTDDGQGTLRTWLRWQTRITHSAASGAVGWMRRLNAHRLVAEALREARVSASWAKQICDWTDRLPASARDDADAILLGAAARGARLLDLAGLVEEMQRFLARPDQDKRPGFVDRGLRLATTLDGVGKLDGDLTPSCAAALREVLDALGKKAGPEDDRTIGQRRHDALAEACRRLIASGCLPDRAGQPTKIQLHISLEELTRRLAEQSGETDRDLGPLKRGEASDADGAGASSGREEFERRLWPRLEPGDGPIPGLPLAPIAAPGEECDASIVPIVSGQVDQDLLDQLVALLNGRDEDPGTSAAKGGERPSIPGNVDRVRGLIVANAAALLSGPRGLASWLRTQTLTGPGATVSLPLDLGKATEVIPPHLRRAVILRDRHCAAPGCQQPPAACQVHHIRPRRKGGRTKLSNLLLLCTFHHLILVHEWDWTIILNPDGTTTMTSPDGSRVYHSHGPPPAVAA